MTAYKEIGLVVGGGRYPLLLASEARRHGVERIVAAAFYSDADDAINDLADEVNWVYVGQLNKLIKSFTKRGIEQVIFCGQITPGRLFKDLRPDLRMMRLLGSLRRKNADTIFGTVATEFEKDGVHVLPAMTFMEDHLALVGVMGRKKPNGKIQADIAFGKEIALAVSRLDIGQTVVVKDGTVLAVEAFEGTDQAIIRGGEVGHGDVTVVKLPKIGQDPRFDIPCIGMRTVDSLRRAQARAVAVKAGETLFVDKEEVLAALDETGIVVYGFTIEDPAEDLS